MIMTDVCSDVAATLSLHLNDLWRTLEVRKWFFPAIRHRKKKKQMNVLIKINMNNMAVLRAKGKILLHYAMHYFDTTFETMNSIP